MAGRRAKLADERRLRHLAALIAVPPLLVAAILFVASVSDKLFIFHIISVVVPVLVAYLLPKELLRRKITYSSVYAHRWFLYGASVLFFVSWYLPSPLIFGQDTSFTTHFVGGGIFSGLIWLYLRRVTAVRYGWSLDAFALFALVSALGVLNELAELFFAVVLGIDIRLTDTSIDLFANTAGALLVYCCVFLRAAWRSVFGETVEK